MTRRQLCVLIATILGSIVVFLDGTIVNLALPKIGQNLHVGFSGLQWIVDGYLLSLSALILIGGSLGDIYGRKKLYLTGLVGFGVSSLLCALAPNVGMLTLLRVVQGVFGAMLVPGALAIINTNFSKSQRGKAIGTWTAFASIAAVIGPLLGGFILGVASWRWIFLINIPLIIVCFYLAATSIEESKHEIRRRLDKEGALLAMASLAGITYGLIQGPTNHWRLASLLPLIVGFGLGAVFIRVESRIKDPMVDLKLFRSRNFLGANIMTFAMYGALSAMTFSLVIYLQTKLGYSAIRAGFSILPVSLTMFLFSRETGRLSARLGPRLFMTFGPMITAVGMLYLSFLKPGDSYVMGILPGVLLFAVGLVITVTPLTTTVMTAVSESSSGIASGINNAISRAAGLIIIALLGLAGADHIFQFAMILSSALAFTAGLVSFVLIRNVKLEKAT